MTAPVLVTGLGRTGTTWVGRMLCLSGELNYLHEPFGFYTSPVRWPAPRLPSRSFYICRDNEADYYRIAADIVRTKYPVRNRLAEVRREKGSFPFKPFKRGHALLARAYLRSLHARLRGAAPLVKDPGAFFSAPWLAERFGLRVVVTVRHPAAVASSIKRLGWKVDFRHWRDQPLLMRDYLHAFEAQLDAHCRHPQDVISQSILLWNMYYTVAQRFRAAHPSWLFVKHEELSADPVAEFRELYRQLNLSWKENVGASIEEYTRPGNLKEDSPREVWTVKRDSRATRRLWAERLTPEEIARIRDGVAEVAQGYYTEADWRSTEGGKG